MVNHKMLHLQEVEVFIVLPAIRRELSRHMKNMGLEQKEIAKRLGVTDAAISQYLSDKRGQADVSFPKEMAAEFDHSARRIKDESSMRVETQRLLKLVLENQFTCQVHKKACGEVPEDCLVCFEKQGVPDVKVAQ